MSLFPMLFLKVFSLFNAKPLLYKEIPFININDDF